MISTYNQSKKDKLKQEGFYSLPLHPMLAELRLGKLCFMPKKEVRMADTSTVFTPTCPTQRRLFSSAEAHLHWTELTTATPQKASCAECCVCSSIMHEWCFTYSSARCHFHTPTFHQCRLSEATTKRGKDGNSPLSSRNIGQTFRQKYGLKSLSHVIDRNKYFTYCFSRGLTTEFRLVCTYHIVQVWPHGYDPSASASEVLIMPESKMNS